MVHKQILVHGTGVDLAYFVSGLSRDTSTQYRVDLAYVRVLHKLILVHGNGVDLTYSVIGV